MQREVQPIRQDRLADLLLESSPVEIVITDLQARILLLNRQAERSFGFREADLIGEPIEILFAANERSADASHLARFLAQPLSPFATADQTDRGLALHGLRKDGSRFPIQISRSLVATKPLILNVLTDLTLVNLGSDERIQTERLAAILQMAKGLAHEGHNALQRAHACLDLLELDLNNQCELLGLIARIRLALSDLLRNYEEVKSYATPIVLRYSPTHLPQLCQTAFDDLVADAQRPPPQLEIASANSTACISVDPLRFKQAVAAVLDNAIDASREADKIEVDLRPIHGCDQETVELTVRDHGEGLSAETSARMFEPFFTTKQHGTGLGLPTCRRVIEAHRGTVTAENHPAGGALLRIRLPLHPLNRETIRQSPQAAATVSSGQKIPKERPME